MRYDCAYTKQQIDAIRNEIQHRLSPQKYAHSCKVAEIAVHFAKAVGYDESMVEAASLLHDVAREYTQEQIDEAIAKYAIRLSRYNLDFPPSIHGKIGSVIAEQEFGITDAEVLAAIRNHVSGRPCMKSLEQIVYLADHVDRLYVVQPDAADELMHKSLDEGMYVMLGQVIRYDAQNKKPIDKRTLQTFDWILEKIRNEEKSGPVDMNNEDLQAFYSRMDALIEICAEHALTDFHAENLRDLGGYLALDGRKIRHGKILRSGNLDRFTPADYEKLSAMGINVVIDLRSAHEKMQKSDPGNTGIRYLEIPFDATCECAPYLEMLLEFQKECDDSEESAWLSAKYFDTLDIDDMYLKLLFDPGSMQKFRSILEIMLGDDCTGILFFCQSGKDRTGIVSAMIMNALGIGSETALDDYMVSQIPYYAITMKYMNQMRRNAYNLTVQNQVIAVLGVEAERPHRLNREILSRFHDYRNYFSFEALFGTEELARFRNKFLES